MFHGKYPSKAYRGGEHVGPGPWLNLIHTANGIAPGLFGEPDSTGDWWAGGWAEHYEHARVIHHPDESTSVTALTEHGDTVLTQAEAVRRGADTTETTLPPEAL